jgi:hypothetical protein
MKKAQLEQPFVIIFGVIVMAFVLIYGGSVIYNSYHLSSDVEFKKFMNDLDKNVQDCYALDSGSLCSLEKMGLPNNFGFICIVNVGDSLDQTKIPVQLNSTIMNFQRMGNIYDNIFLSNPSKENEPYHMIIKNLKASENPLCTRTIGGKLRLILENKGNYVQIRK